MPVFIFLVFLGGFIVWLLLSGMYKVIGKYVGGLFKDAKDAMSDEDPGPTEAPSEDSSQGEDP